ncbi:MAG: class I SAM-dependent methyltransferase [Fimbriimonadales bacterium]|nr:class I SAM-dependent methyltransferase [Fimbriimonadales bacterium]
MPVAYRDGAEDSVLSVLRTSPQVGSLCLLSPDGAPWEVQYHLRPERGNLLRPFDFEGLSVLEFGAGMGGASRCVAERCAAYVGVEGSALRAEGLRERLRDLPHARVEVCNLIDFRSDQRFDVVLIVGVLEYAGLYVSADDRPFAPYQAVLRHAMGFLAPGGSVVLAIENRNGLKYWAGAPEDHTSRPYDGILGYPFRECPRTFSRKTLLSLLRSVGLTEVDEFYPWPDYKLPSVVVSRRLAQSYPFFSAELAADAHARAMHPPPQNFPLSLAAMELARSGLLEEFANSFLFVGFQRLEGPIRSRLLRRMFQDREVAWHYSLNRRVPSETAFAEDGAGGLVVRKRALATVGEGFSLAKWKPKAEFPAKLEQSVFQQLRAFAFAGRDAEFLATIASFLEWGFARWRSPDGCMLPEALDANPTNAVPSAGGFELFDIEWEALEPFPASWFVFRCLFTIEDALAMFPKPPWHTLEDLYRQLCERFGIEEDLEGDIRRETAFQRDTHRHLTADAIRDQLEARFREPRAGSGYQRDSLADWQMRAAFAGGDAPIRPIARLLALAVVRRLRRVVARVACRFRPTSTVSIAGLFGMLGRWLARS